MKLDKYWFIKVWLNTQLVGGGGCGGHVINSQSESHFTGTLQYNYRYITKGHTQNNAAGKGYRWSQFSSKI